MKGKKTDPIFISQFIQNAVKEGDNTPEQFVARAKVFIEVCDKAIQEAEVAKKMRSRYLDVIATFEKQSKDKTVDAKLLEFFSLRDPERCKEICDSIKEHQFLPVLGWSSFGNETAYNFCVKQLLEADIIAREGDRLIPGIRFRDYIKFALHEEV